PLLTPLRRPLVPALSGRGAAAQPSPPGGERDAKSASNLMPRRAIQLGARHYARYPVEGPSRPPQPASSGEPMPRSHVVLVGLAILTSIFLPPAASAKDSSISFDTDRDGFGWAIVSGENTSMSDMDDLDSFDNLKEKYGDEFLFLREGDNRYVIRDRG